MNISKIYKKHHFMLFLSLLFVGSLLLRVVSLASLPVGFHFDEVNAGYNAYSLLKTGESVKNGPWPLYLDTFGDFRPMGIVYLIMPSVAVFGMTEFAVRLPIALLGAFSPLLLFFLVRLYSRDSLWAGIAGVFLAISPWHIILSRATSESILAVFFAMLIVYLFKVLLDKGTMKWAVFLYLTMAISYISYHPINLFLIFFFPILILFFHKELLKKKKTGLLVIGVFLIYLVFPFFTGIFGGNSTGRLSQVVSIYSETEQKHLKAQLVEEGVSGNILVARMFHNKIVNTTFELGERYMQYLSPNYLFFEGGIQKRYLTPDVGLVNVVEFLGLLLLFLPLVSIEKKRVFYLFLVWLLIGIIPAAITTDDQPNVSRSVLMLPALQVLAAYGLLRVSELLNKRVRGIAVVFLIVISIWHLSYFLHQYAVHARYYQWLDRSFPGKEIAKVLTSIDPKKKVVVTTHFLDPEMFIYFYAKTDPKIPQKNQKNRIAGTVYSWNNLTFVKDECPLQKYHDGFDYSLEQGWCVEPREFPKQTIMGADDNPAFILVTNDKDDDEEKHD